MNQIKPAVRNYILFDGDCGICTWSSEFAREIDGGKNFIIQAYQRFSENELMRFGLSYQKCNQKLQVITSKGRIYSGAFGINYFLWKQFPWTCLVVLIYALPILLMIELILYRLIAANRGRISQWLGMKACLLK